MNTGRPSHANTNSSFEVCRKSTKPSRKWASIRPDKVVFGGKISGKLMVRNGKLVVVAGGLK